MNRFQRQYVNIQVNEYTAMFSPFNKRKLLLWLSASSPGRQSFFSKMGSTPKREFSPREKILTFKSLSHFGKAAKMKSQGCFPYSLLMEKQVTDLERKVQALKWLN